MCSYLSFLGFTGGIALLAPLLLLMGLFRNFHNLSRFGWCGDLRQEGESVGKNGHGAHERDAAVYLLWASYCKVYMVQGRWLKVSGSLPGGAWGAVRSCLSFLGLYTCFFVYSFIR